MRRTPLLAALLCAGLPLLAHAITADELIPKNVAARGDVLGDQLIGSDGVSQQRQARAQKRGQQRSSPHLRTPVIGLVGEAGSLTCGLPFLKTASLIRGWMQQDR